MSLSPRLNRTLKNPLPPDAPTGLKHSSSRATRRINPSTSSAVCNGTVEGLSVDTIEKPVERRCGNAKACEESMREDLVEHREIVRAVVETVDSAQVRLAPDVILLSGPRDVRSIETARVVVRNQNSVHETQVEHLEQLAQRRVVTLACALAHEPQVALDLAHHAGRSHRAVWLPMMKGPARGHSALSCHPDQSLSWPGAVRPDLRPPTAPVEHLHTPGRWNGSGCR